MLSLARSLFQEQMSLERLVTTIIREAKDLLKCERCTVYLLDLKMYDAVSIPFKLITANDTIAGNGRCQGMSMKEVDVKIEWVFFVKFDNLTTG